ncbi:MULTISPECIES: hypothetical protein [Auritidibacter]|uniref:Uncharacterized protein n=1 Tax=Auritidibacter ignavus TaxID=678932 RepID=A0AAJ6AKA8_9MICC|nr:MULTISPECIES: hypothetical protein [Auritidibacter]PXA78993.1 hypothetical protein DCC26_06260 [Auritidibacter sp. NML120779]AXR73948.1 hypothetical protein DCC27_006135 [Auritidibacter sp. NML130574]WGH84460.1 hypothetical protein QDX20_02735 [Auritidibacter ignavus]WGH93784.1 hypothetical protein QDX21_03020 [Auritidibacter ignavus]WHS27399.1 hypothetical protein QM395_08415 [Auritidibacter ignavus]
MSIKATDGWIIGIIAFAIVGSISFFVMGDTFGGTAIYGVISALIFLTILLGFVVLNSRGSRNTQDDDDDDI